MLSAPKLGAPSTARSGWPKSWGLWYPRTPRLRSDPESPAWQRVAGRAQSMGAQHTTRPGSEPKRRLQKPGHVHFASLPHDRKSRASGKALVTWTQETYKTECPKCICYGLKLVPRDLPKPKPQWLRTCPSCGNRVPADVICWDQSHQGGPRSERTGVLRRRRPGETPTGRGPLKTEAET